MSKSIFHKIDQLKHTRKGLLISAVIELIAAYLFASMAIDSANYWYYLITIILLVGGLKNLYQLVTYGKR